jgi:hypothetical protein
MNTITYRIPKLGDEHQISGCMWASEVLWELTDGTLDSIESKSENSQDYIDCPPEFVTAPECLKAIDELIQREPIFHHPEFGTTRADFENMTALLT